MTAHTYRSRPSLQPLEDRVTPSPAGDLDLAFGEGGKVVVPFGSIQSPSNLILDAVAYLGGKILVVGSSVTSMGPNPASTGNYDFTAVLLNGGGTPDPAFGTGGRATVGFDLGESLVDRAWAVAVQPDGRIVLAGSAAVPGHTSNMALTRLNPDGSPDLTFGTDAKVVVAFPGGGSSDVADVAVLPDGKIVVAGTYNAGFTDNRMAAARLNPDGSLDPTFGSGGLVTVPFDIGAGNTHAVAKALVVQPDGKLLLAGHAVSGSSPNPTLLNFDFAAARLNPDGGIDPTFGTGGRFTVGFDLNANPEDYADAAAVQSDGTILLAGKALATNNGFDFGVVRLRPDGTLDPTFGTGGRVVIPFEAPGTATQDAAAALTLLPDGNILVAGSSGYFNVFAVARMKSNGSLDPAFGSGGMTTVDYGAPEVRSFFAQTLVLPDGKVLLVGSVSHTTPEGFSTEVALARLLGDPPVPPPPPPPPPVVPVLAGGTADGSAVRLVPAGGQLVVGDTVTFFPDFVGVVRTAVADVTGDGVADYVGGAGPGGGPRGAGIDGQTMAAVADWLAFEGSFTGGVYVAAADLDGDGKAEVVVTPDQGGGPVATVYAGSKLVAGVGGDEAQIVRFLGIDDPSFRGGARVALGDVTGDGKADLVMAAGFLGGPRVTVWDGASVLDGSPAQVLNFFAFEDSLRNGAFVAAGDVTGDGVAKIAFGGGPGGAPRVRVFDGTGLLSAVPFANLDVVPSAQLANFFAGDSALRGGVRVLLQDADGDGQADLVTGSGEGEPSRVQVYFGPNLLATATPAADQELDPFGTVLADGVFVG